MSDKLNLGCGRQIKSGYVNLDIINWEGVDIVRDVLRGIPFNDNWFDEVTADYLITQIANNKDFIFVMNEVWRVLKRDGVFKLKVPDVRYTGTDSFNDPMDSRRFSKNTFDYLDVNHYRWSAFNYGFQPWIINQIIDEVGRPGRLYIEMTPANK